MDTWKVGPVELKSRLILGSGKYKDFAETRRAIDASGFSRCDFFLEQATDRVILNEINTIPGMTELSLLPKAAAVAGLDYPSLCEEIAGLSMAKKHR